MHKNSKPDWYVQSKKQNGRSFDYVSSAFGINFSL